MFVFDAHLHMGYLSDTDIIQPTDINSFIHKHNVCGGAIMPTASINGLDDFKLHIDLYKKADYVGFSTILYVTPEIIESIKKSSASELWMCEFIGLKIHPEAIDYTEMDLERIIEFAVHVSLPLFIHTGGKYNSEAIRFEKLIKHNPNQIIVLCHARPSDQAFYLIDKYPNVWVDTAFLPIDDLYTKISLNNQGRILFGSDYPINRWYSELPEENLWYESQINDIITNLDEKQAEDILRNNYLKFISSNRKIIKL